MDINHLNHTYDGAVPNVPLGVGDRYYAQDLARDFWYLTTLPAWMLKSMYKAFPALLKDTMITKGTAWTDLNIPAAAGLVEYSVNVPDSFASIPPTVKSVTSVQLVENPDLTDVSIAGTATLNGVAVNYVKLAYNETNGSTRNRAKKAGSYAYERAPSYTITVSAAAPTNAQVVLAEVVGDGATFLTITHRTRTPLNNDPFDYVVRTQNDFNRIFARVSANRYKIIDSIQSIKFEYLAGGYLANGFLQGGDTWGYVETNNCNHIVFAPPAYINDADTAFYIKVVTNYGTFENIDIRGGGGAAAAISYSFFHDASHCHYSKCKTSGRKTSATFYGFYGDISNVEDFYSSDFIGCEVFSNDSIGGVTNIGFYRVYNLAECYTYNLTSTSPGINGYSICENLVNCHARNLTGGTGSAVGFSSCNQLINCSAETLASGGVGNSIGFNNCKIVSTCHAKTISITGNSVGYGFLNCMRLTSCYAEDINASIQSAIGFYGCEIISACEANNINGTTNGYGFNDCFYISSCKADAITGAINEGFHGCMYGASLGSAEPANSVNDYIDTVDAQITNKVSTASIFT